ncbi:MAG TPA: hypothetical protein HPP80_06700 [Rhodospirillaceae bacterium]|nr:hypothetical protein [Rhodospirillaceae bacterium]
MLRSRERQVGLGDKFVKAGDSIERWWEVVHLMTAVDGILHARLAFHGKESELRTIAVPALLDDKYWRAATVQS